MRPGGLARGGRTTTWSSEVVQHVDGVLDGGRERRCRADRQRAAARAGRRQQRLPTPRTRAAARPARGRALHLHQAGGRSCAGAAAGRRSRAATGVGMGAERRAARPHPAQPGCTSRAAPTPRRRRADAAPLVLPLNSRPRERGDGAHLRGVGRRGQGPGLLQPEQVRDAPEPTKSLDDAKLYANQDILAEVQGADGTWPATAKAATRARAALRWTSSTARTNNTNNSGWATGRAPSARRPRRRRRRHGAARGRRVRRATRSTRRRRLASDVGL